MTVTRKDFQALQHQFSACIRDPQQIDMPGVEERRMKVYQELFFNNIYRFTASAFPVATSIMSTVWWRAAVRDFLINYRCTSPFFSDISAQFLTFLQEGRQPTPEQPAFLLELMHYEWVELALDTAEADPFAGASELTDRLLEGHPVQSPLAWSLNYRYPVHRISAQAQPQTAPAQPTWLMVYRNRENLVQFMELNALTARLLQLLAEDEALTGRAALRQLATEMEHPDVSAFEAFGHDILIKLQGADILLGARRVP